ncbi:MAG: hypothetical protein MUC48_06060 [Leptolyngbya sp. Prado105]|jgi:hypothetical protein|nr:hypothetical protein [Leptolyngbya sp. Prado105]
MKTRRSPNLTAKSVSLHQLCWRIMIWRLQNKPFRDRNLVLKKPFLHHCGRNHLRTPRSNLIHTLDAQSNEEEASDSDGASN